MKDKINCPLFLWERVRVRAGSMVVENLTFVI
jgi:hypothetical protein